jgi:copper chaperone CopZ
MRLFLAIVALGALATGATAAEPATKNASPTTKATYMITGLHCPPCTRVVESSLKPIEGVRSAKIDWKTKLAQIEFDEKLVPAQTLAQRIASTPHLMGDEMHYGGWLALKAPAVKDEATGKKAKEALSKLAGVKEVAVYPKQQSIGVEFDAKGKLKSQDVIDALKDAGIEASNL